MGGQMDYWCTSHFKLFLLLQKPSYSILDLINDVADCLMMGMTSEDNLTVVTKELSLFLAFKKDGDPIDVAIKSYNDDTPNSLYLNLTTDLNSSKTSNILTLQVVCVGCQIFQPVLVFFPRNYQTMM